MHVLTLSRLARGFGFAAPLSVIAACSGSSTGTDSDGAETTAATADSSTSATSETEAGPACAATPDLGPSVRVTVRNERPRPVIVANAVSSDCYDDIVPLSIAGQDGPILWRTVTRQFACTHFAGGGGCDYGCGALQAAVCLEPGGTFEDAWSGNRWLAQDTPAACDAPEYCQECFVEEAVPPGSYTITVQALEVDDCECFNESDDGWCHTSSFAFEPDTERSEELDYPTETELELVLE